MSDKLISSNDLSGLIEKLKSENKKIVFTNGCFDLIHPGHIKVFKEAKEQGDVLILGLNSDQSIKSIKDPRRPILNQDERSAILGGLESIDYIALFDEQTPANLINSILPDVLVKGGDWGLDNIVGADTVKANGGRVHVVSLKEGNSTTNIIERVLEKYG